MARTLNVLLVVALVAPLLLAGCGCGNKHKEAETEYCDEKTSNTYKK